MSNKNLSDRGVRNLNNFDLDVISSSGKNFAWLPLVYSYEGYRIMGITSKGEWLVKVNHDFFFLDTKESFLFAISFMEMPLNDIKQQVLQKIDLNIENIEFEQFFPLTYIIGAGFNNGQYWASLAMNWIENLSLKYKILFLSELEVLTTSQWAGQSLRQRASREMKKIKQYIDEHMNE